MKNCCFIFLVSLLFINCKKDDDTASLNDTPNILVIIADDFGKDAMNGFSEGNVKPNTPHLDELMAEGLTFNNFWTNPSCTPTRSAILTGKYGYRTNVKWAGDVLDPSETILHNYISQRSNYATSIAGKWHLSGGNSQFNPETMGVDYYKGLATGSVTSYTSWTLTEDGNTTTSTNYITEEFTDIAIDWINNQSKPWFCWLAYTAPHTPFHVPPPAMHSQGVLPTYDASLDAKPYFMAAAEAMDYQIGRLFDSIPEDELENTVIIFLGDNGTPKQASQAPYRGGKTKGSLYQGGINTPLIIKGKGVSRTGEVDDNLINNTDLFATISTLAGVNTEEINDSKDFSILLKKEETHRDFVYTEINENVDAWTIRNNQYKLIEDANGRKEFYDLTTDAYEDMLLDLLNLTTIESTALQSLESELQIIRN